MNKQVKRFYIFQTSKVIAVMYLIASAIFLIPVGIYAMYNQDVSTGLLFWVLILIYGLLAFIGTAISCWLYNIVASKMGGIAVEVEEFDIKD